MFQQDPHRGRGAVTDWKVVRPASSAHDTPIRGTVWIDDVSLKKQAGPFLEKQAGSFLKK